MFGRIVLLAVLALPLVEIALFIVIGQAIGVLPTLLGIVLTGAVGALVLRWQGTAALREMQFRLQRGAGLKVHQAVERRRAGWQLAGPEHLQPRGVAALGTAHAIERVEQLHARRAATGRRRDHDRPAARFRRPRERRAVGVRERDAAQVAVGLEPFPDVAGGRRAPAAEEQRGGDAEAAEDHRRDDQQRRAGSGFRGSVHGRLRRLRTRATTTVVAASPNHWTA